MSNGRVGPNWGFSLITTVVMVMATTDVVTMAEEENNSNSNECSSWGSRRSRRAGKEVVRFHNALMEVWVGFPIPPKVGNFEEMYNQNLLLVVIQLTQL